MAEYYLDALTAAKNYQSSILRLITRNLPFEHARWKSPVLDFGAGHGDYALHMGKRGYDVQVLEPDPACQGELKKRGLSTLSVMAPGAYRAIYSLNVFEHIEDDAEALQRCYRALLPGGRLFLYVPAHEEIWTALDDAVGHRRRYTQGGLRKLLTDGGFRVLGSGEHDYAGYWVSRWFARDRGKPVRVTTARVLIFDRVVFPLGPLIRWIYPGSPGKNVWIVGEKIDV